MDRVGVTGRPDPAERLQETAEMALKTYNPTTPGQRGLILVDRSGLWKGGPVKALTKGQPSKAGRNNTGRITMRRRGGGAKRRYRILDFKRSKLDVPAKVERIEYDPNRTASSRSFVTRTASWPTSWPRSVWRSVTVSWRQPRPTSGPATRCRSRDCRSAPSCTTSNSRPARAVSLREQREPTDNLLGGTADTPRSACLGRVAAGAAGMHGTVGAVSNPDNGNQNLGKAGRNRHRGIRPSVRGV